MDNNDIDDSFIKIKKDLTAMESLIFHIKKEQVKKKLLLSLSPEENSSPSTPQEILSEYLSYRKSLPEDKKDLADINFIASNSLNVLEKPVCVFYTTHGGANISKHYSFANTPGYNTCSQPDIVANAKSNSPIPCSFGLSQSNCNYYQPDIALVSKDIVEDKHYALAKARTFTASFLYFIYDSDLNVYQTLNYSNISDKDNILDKQAISIYREFLSSQISVSSIPLEISLADTAPNNKSSYLMSLVS
jgi:hypothetical protein